MGDLTANPPQLLAIAFVQDARAFVESARTLASVHRAAHLPTYFLLGQAIELVLKAHLSASGVSKKTLSSKDIRHSIDVLFRMARDDFGFVPADDRFPDLVRWLAPYHRDHLFRYRKAVGHVMLPVASEAAEIILNTIDGVRGVEPTMLEMSRSYGLTAVQRWFRN